MNKLYLTKADGIYDSLDRILIELTGEKQTILRTEKGKPYINGNPVYFSISHSKEYGAIAVCDRPVGVDLEVFAGKDRQAVISRLPLCEREEITCENDFLSHWTAREAFIKMTGGTLAEDFKSIAYCGGKMYFDGILQSCELFKYVLDYGIVTVCAGDKI